jgi:hypothetical protein
MGGGSPVTTKKAKPIVPDRRIEFITRHRGWSVKDTKHLYVHKIVNISGEEYKDVILKEEFMKIANAIYSLGKEDKEITRPNIAKMVYHKYPGDHEYWWVDNTIGILLLEGFLDYIGGKAPQRFRITEKFVPDRIFEKIRDCKKNCVNLFSDIIHKEVTWYSTELNSKNFSRKKA